MGLSGRWPRQRQFSETIHLDKDGPPSLEGMRKEGKESLTHDHVQEGGCHGERKWGGHLAGGGKARCNPEETYLWIPSGKRSPG